MKLIRFAGLLLSAALAPTLVTAAAAPNYKVLDRIKVQDGGYDYATFDPATDRVYMARDDFTTVIDAKTGKVSQLSTASHGHMAIPVPGTTLVVLEVEVPPGSGTPPHTHASPEIFRVLSGEVAFGRFGEDGPGEDIAGPGTVVTVPSGVPHNYRNAGSTVASMLVVAERSMSDFFRDVGRRDAPPAGPPSEAEIGAMLAACARHGILVLGGPPTR